MEGQPKDKKIEEEENIIEVNPIEGTPLEWRDKLRKLIDQL